MNASQFTCRLIEMLKSRRSYRRDNSQYRIMKKSFIIILITGILFCYQMLQGSFARIPVNLIRNPGFESFKKEMPEGWIIKTSGGKLDFIVETDHSEFHTGKASCKISQIWQASSVPGISIADPLFIDPHKKYLLSFWSKTRGISEYPMALISRFNVKCEKTPALRYQKRISNSEQWQHIYILLDNIPADALSLRIDFCTDISTRGTIWLDDVDLIEAGNAEVAMFEKWRRQQIPGISGNAKGIKFDPTGYFRVEKTDDRWWFVDPQGNPAWAIAVAGALPARNTENPATQTSWFKKKYGVTADSYTKKIYEIFTGVCGFNSLAGWSSEKIASISGERYVSGQSYMPVTQVLGLSSFEGSPDIYVKNRDGSSLNKPGHPMVDPFNPEWRRMAREKAERVIPANKNKPWLIGWYIDNEIDFKNLCRYVWAEYSSKEFIKNLTTKYKNIDSLNHSWTSLYGEHKYTSFDEILQIKPEPKHWDDPLYEDFTAFERKMLEAYITYTYKLVKEIDPDHLVISNRIHLTPMPDISRTIDLWGRYDIICMNIYPENNKIGFDAGELEIMQKLHQGTGRPVLIGEWSVPAIDSKLYETGIDSLGRPLDWSWPQVVRTQKERGEVYETCMKQLASQDYIIGAGWFITMDVDTKIRRANRGLMNSRFEIYRELTSKMNKTNKEIKKGMHLKQ
jgi:hypothetical protein